MAARDSKIISHIVISQVIEGDVDRLELTCSSRLSPEKIDKR